MSFRFLFLKGLFEIDSITLSFVLLGYKRE